MNNTPNILDTARLDRQRAIAEAGQNTMGYDTKCYDLAADWLDGEMNTEENRASLAQAIQDACEDWDIEHPEPPRHEPEKKPL